MLAWWLSLLDGQSLLDRSLAHTGSRRPISLVSWDSCILVVVVMGAAILLMHLSSGLATIGSCWLLAALLHVMIMLQRVMADCKVNVRKERFPCVDVFLHNRVDVLMSWTSH